MIVKFEDRVMARSDGNGGIVWSSRHYPYNLASLIRRYQLHFEAVFEDEEAADDIRKRAALATGVMQPDLLGNFYVSHSNEFPTGEIANELYALDSVEMVTLTRSDRLPPPPADIAPATPDLTGDQTYLLDQPGYGVNLVHTMGIRGAGVRIAHCEYGYRMTHEDLAATGITYASTHPLNPQLFTSTYIGFVQHGTAVAGILFAGDNGYGITGIAPDAEKAFYSEWTTAGVDRTGAITQAINDSEAGDIILLEMQDFALGSGSSSSQFAPAEISYPVWQATKVATDAGIIVVAAAGNGNVNLDGSEYDTWRSWGDSGAIIVGAGSSDVLHNRLTFSNYGFRVDVQAWGQDMSTTSSGPNWGTLVRYGDDDDQAYVTAFNGTSSATASVAGITALIQSYAKQVLGTTITPLEMRSFLADTGFDQGNGGNIGPAVSALQALDQLPSIGLTAQLDPNGPEDFQLRFYGLPFRTYTVETTESFQNEWQPLFQNIAGDNEAVEIPLNRTDSPRRFFRVVETD